VVSSLNVSPILPGILLLSLSAQAQPGPVRQSLLPALPRDQFDSCRREVQHGRATILLEEAHRTTGPMAPPFFCAAMVQVAIPGNAPVLLKFEDIEPVGSRYGVSILEQSVGRYRVLAKRGDYDGKLILVSPEGKVEVVPGPGFIVIAKKYLVLRHDSDSSGLAVFDLQRGKLKHFYRGQEFADLLAGTSVLEDDSLEWFELGGEYLTGLPRTPEPGRTYHVVQLELGTAKLKKRTMTGARLEKAKRVPYAGLDEWRDCACAEGPANR
jgi:hypothetical protein